MNRTLKRPMFRRGGSAGTGITSGLDQPRKQYQNGDRVSQNLNPYIEDTLKAYREYGGVPEQSLFAPGTGPGFLTSFGLDLLGRAPAGNIFQTMGLAAKGPFERFQAGTAARAAEQAALNRSAIDKAISMKETADATSASMKKTQMLIDADISMIDQEHANEIEKIKLEADLGTGDSTTYAKKQAAEAYRATYAPELEKLNDLISNTADPDLRAQYESQKEGILNKIIRGQQAIYLDQKSDTEFNREIILKILQGAATSGELEDAEGISNIFNAISQIFPNYQEILGPDFKLPGQAMADGGRAGYQMGGMTDPMGSVQAEAQVQDLSFSELRSRLPESISNDVVNILANSKQALLDFANIRDQQDVDEFNQRYGVSLSIPQEG